MRATAGLLERLGRYLVVQDAGPRRHPLRVAFADEAAATVRVVVLDHAVDDVRDGLEPAVRVPRRADGLVRRVLDGAELVEEEERVGDVGVDAAGERAPHLEARAFDDMLRRHDGRDAPMHGVRAGCGDAREDERVVDGDRGHAHVNRHARGNYSHAPVPASARGRYPWPRTVGRLIAPLYAASGSARTASSSATAS